MDDYKEDDDNIENQQKKQFDVEPESMLYKTIVSNKPIELDLNGLYSEDICIISQVLFKLLDILHDGGNIEDLPAGIIHQIFNLKNLEIDNIQIFILDIFFLLFSTSDEVVCTQITEEYFTYIIDTIEEPQSPLLLLSALEILQNITNNKPQTSELLNGNEIIDHVFSSFAIKFDNIEHDIQIKITTTSYLIISNCLLYFQIDKAFFDLYTEQIKYQITAGEVFPEQLDGIISVCKIHPEYASIEFGGIEILQNLSALANQEDWKLTNKLFDVVLNIAQINPKSAIQIISTDFFSNIIPDSEWSNESIQKHLSLIKIALDIFRTVTEPEKLTHEYQHAKFNLIEYSPILISMYLQNMYNCQYILRVPITSIICNLLNLGQRLIIHQVVTSQEELIPHLCSMTKCGDRDLIYQITNALGSLLEFGDSVSIDFGQKNIYLSYLNTEEIDDTLEQVLDDYREDVAIVKRIKNIKYRLEAMIEFEKIDQNNGDLDMEVFL